MMLQCNWACSSQNYSELTPTLTHVLQILVYLKIIYETEFLFPTLLISQLEWYFERYAL